jgi:predicted alpha/beta hydrolase family esterase
MGSAPVGISVLQVAHSCGCLLVFQLNVVRSVSRVSGSLFLLVLSYELQFAKEQFVCSNAVSSLPLELPIC